MNGTNESVRIGKEETLVSPHHRRSTWAHAHPIRTNHCACKGTTVQYIHIISTVWIEARCAQVVHSSNVVSTSTTADFFTIAVVPSLLTFSLSFPDHDSFTATSLLYISAIAALRSSAAQIFVHIVY
jgi:hypothetical protein